MVVKNDMNIHNRKKRKVKAKGVKHKDGMKERKVDIKID